MKLAIMQPYFFPYIGYFQLINSVDKFIFYDDVNYIKGGWVNRNNILVNGNNFWITLQLKKASPNKNINEIYVGNNKGKIIKTIYQYYKKAPYFNHCIPIIDLIFNNINSGMLLSSVAALTIKEVAKYLAIDVKFEFSSLVYENTKLLRKEDRLIKICKLNGAKTYINPIGGKSLYTKEIFKKNDIDLFFLKTLPIEYKQFKDKFVPNLSIIDVMMFNSIEKIREMLFDFELV